ncbi:MAG: hypothetical protein HC854_16530 [Flavobacterium sp.]|nr:hypothetical protein [Flavobacterium sp.]
MKKIYLGLIILAQFCLNSCEVQEELNAISSREIETTSEKRLQFGEQVKLIKASDYSFYGCSRGGCFGNQNREFIVEVSNLAYNKSVQVYQELTSGSWEFFNLTYSGSTSNGNEIWKGTDVKTFSSRNATYYSGKIAVKYTVNGQTYWDNNGGNNYVISQPNTLNVKTVYLANSLNIIDEFSRFYKYTASDNTIYSRLFVNVELRNIGYAKEVKIIYTTNNWASSTSKNLTFASNGLTYVVERFKNEPIAGHITLFKGERSSLAERAALLL